MQDEIRTVQTHLTKIIKEIKSGQPSPDLRVGIVTYRDHPSEEQEYLWRKLDLTYGMDTVLNYIWDIEASGGGDLPEAVTDGLNVAINDMGWGTVQNQYAPINTKQLIFLIGDAAPHGVGANGDNHPQDIGYNYKDLIEQANMKDITIYTVSGSGIDSVGIKVFQDIALRTGGQYTHLSYMRESVEDYYVSEGFSQTEVAQYVEAAKDDADYDRATNSILTNSLGVFTQKAMAAEAQELGVDYTPEAPEETTPNDDSFGSFLRSILTKLAFWR